MTIDELPERLPIFPLTGQLLLPGSAMPLHIFEPRYRAMTEDALAGERMIGMVQPLVPARDNLPAPDLGREDADDGGPTPERGFSDDLESGPEMDAAPQSQVSHPEVYPIGCAGVIDRSKRLDDGRFVILLRGICRFRIAEELDIHRGYRRVRPLWDDFAADLRDPAAPQPVDSESDDRTRSDLIRGVARFASANGMRLDVERLAELNTRQLVDGLAAALPFEPAEKQALLEALDLDHRTQLLTSLLTMASATNIDPDTTGLEN